MDTMTAVLASGLRARQESLDLIANNLANASKAGFKADRELYDQFVAPDPLDASVTGPDPTFMPVIQSQWTDFRQGALQVTGNPLDIALSGEGAFQLQGPTGPVYTRDGAFRMGPDGTVASQDGLPLLMENGRPLKVDPAAAVTVSPEGVVSQRGQVVGRLQVADLSNGVARKDPSGRFTWTSPTPPPPSAATVMQGQLEGSNVGPAESAVRLVSVMRQFEMLQRAISVGAEMGRKATEEVARVGN